MEIIDSIKKVSLFENLPNSVLEKIAKISREEFHPQGSILFEEGSEGTSLYIILSGEVAAEKRISEQEERFKTLGIMTDGDVFGEMALFDKQVRSATIKVRKDLKVLSISQENFQNFLTEDIAVASQIVGKIINVLSQRLRDSNRELISLYETCKIIATANNKKELLQNILKETLRAIPSEEGGLIAFWNEITEEFDVQDFAGISPDESFNLLDKYKSLVDKMKSSQEPVLAGKDDNPDISSLLMVPVIEDKKVLGLILLLNRKLEHAFIPAHINLVASLAVQTAVAFKNISFREEEEAKKRLNQYYI